MHLFGIGLETSFFCFSAPSPQGLKRYEGVEQGLNQLANPSSKGAPYKLSDPGVSLGGGSRNKSPPLKKTKRKETYPPAVAHPPPHHLNPLVTPSHGPTLGDSIHLEKGDVSGFDQHRFTMLGQ